eukprot:5062306-Pyramimonas_sp.AAC.1
METARESMAPRRSLSAVDGVYAHLPRVVAMFSVSPSPMIGFGLMLVHMAYIPFSPGMFQGLS